jgi:Nucleotidyltransferase domain
MLAGRILSTLRFFDLQGLPLTSFEIHQYLISETNILRTKLDDRFEFLQTDLPPTPPVHFDTILTQLHILTREGGIVHRTGFYALPGKEDLIQNRLSNYLNGLKREKLIQRYLIPTKYIPFVRGIALAGSQALGQQRPSSDIDLLIVTDPNRMWTARTLLSAWFQIFGVRRHGNKIANRFCLNHYLANPREVDAERNLYKAMEYTKLCAIGDGSQIRRFQRANENWIRQFFPNVGFPPIAKKAPPRLQRWLEKIFNNGFGNWLEQQLGNWQQNRIRQDQFVFVRRDELSFHPESKHHALLAGFFQ